jgi:hypothetical protein
MSGGPVSSFAPSVTERQLRRHGQRSASSDTAWIVPCALGHGPRDRKPQCRTPPDFRAAGEVRSGEAPEQPVRVPLAPWGACCFLTVAARSFPRAPESLHRPALGRVLSWRCPAGWRRALPAPFRRPSRAAGRGRLAGNSCSFERASAWKERAVSSASSEKESSCICSAGSSSSIFER